MCFIDRKCKIFKIFIVKKENERFVPEPYLLKRRPLSTCSHWLIDIRENKIDILRCFCILKAQDWYLLLLKVRSIFNGSWPHFQWILNNFELFPFISLPISTFISGTGSIWVGVVFTSWRLWQTPYTKTFIYICSCSTNRCHCNLFVLKPGK